MRERERESTDNDIIFLVFCCSSRTCLLASPVFTSLRRVLDPFAAGKNGCRNFQPDFTLLRLVPNFLSCFRSCVPLTAFPFEFLPVNQNPSSICCRYIFILNPGVHYYLDLDMGVTRWIMLNIKISKIMMLLCYSEYKMSLFRLSAFLVARCNHEERERERERERTLYDNFSINPRIQNRHKLPSYSLNYVPSNHIY